jgi:nucleotide-binding universal stress UspA family protein
MKILLPTDGSDFSQNAMGSAMAFAKALSAKVIGLHVVPQFHMPRDEGDLLPPSVALKKRVDEEHKAGAQQVLASVEKEAKGAGVECECIVGINDTVHEEIIGTAEKQGCDLIIMASHGHAGMTALLLGSEPAKVLTHTKLPVLVLR